MADASGVLCAGVRDRPDPGWSVAAAHVIGAHLGVEGVSDGRRAGTALIRVRLDKVDKHLPQCEGPYGLKIAR